MITSDITGAASALSHGRTRFMVVALMVSVASCMLNASMLSPAIRDINAEFGPHGYASMSTYFHLSSAISTVVLIRWSDYIGRKRVLVAVLVVQCLGTLLYIAGTSLLPLIVGRILQGGSNITFGLAGTIVAQGTKAGFESALWICVAIGVAALTASIILKPRSK